MSTHFAMTIENEALYNAIRPAIQAAQQAPADEKGVVIAQIYLHPGDRVEIRGDFIEHKFAFPIFKALKKRAESSADSGVKP